MKYKIFIPIIILILFCLVLTGKILAAEEMQRKIIVFKPEISNEEIKENLISRFGGRKLKDLKLIRSKVAFLSPRMEKLLKDQKEVLRIDDDVEVYALARSTRIRPTATPTPTLFQVLPWGIDRIDADLAWQISSGSGVRVAIVDTGIDTGHPDLKANIKGGINTIYSWLSYNDDNGHGTHVAGIVAAVNNNFGVVGVGPQINLYGVKVLNKNGSGYLSDIIEGLDWAIQNKMQVVNMSLGTSADVQSFHDAIQRVNAAGIVQVAAAGNSGGAVIFPAAYPEVIAVSAVDISGAIASWSSRGMEVDLAAPGVNIYSTYKGSAYQTLSGTSMASPHVAGVAALVLSQTEKCDSDLNGVCSPIEVQQRLENTAEDLGIVGKDNLYGAGLVDVEKAILQ